MNSLKQLLMKIPNSKPIIFALIITLLLTACGEKSIFNRHPKQPNTPPEQDKELQSTIDVMYATQAITDIDMIMGCMGVTDLYPITYTHSPASDVSVPGVGTYRIIRDAINDPSRISAAYNRTSCMDGKMRWGTISMYYQNPQLNTEYYSDYGFVAQGSLSEYQVDDWRITTDQPIWVYNLLPAPNWNAASTKMSWLIEGSFKFEHRTDPKRNMVWTGKIVKTLTNTSDRRVYDGSRLVTINWPLAQVEYTVSATGVTNGDVPFKLEVNEHTPLVRDFQCYPNPIGGVTVPGPQSWKLEFHPFNKGIAYFTTGDKYMRQIFLGNEGSPALQSQCDNTGEVLIKGISYDVVFAK
jgi:hypothetical protein